MNAAIQKKLKQKLESQFKKIEALADLKGEEIEKHYYEKYNVIFQGVIKILKKHPVLLYGGTAINEVLPEKLRFYGAYELPDIDVFCKKSDFKTIQDNIIEGLNKQGFHLTSVKEALHENTYKIMAEGLQLVDLTIISDDTFETLKKGGHKTSYGISTVNIDYLKYSLHNLLSQPLDAHRWPKVFERLVKLYEIYPTDVSCEVNIKDYFLDIPKELAKEADRISKQRRLISFGWDIIQMFLESDDTLKKSMKDFFDPVTSLSLTGIHYYASEEDPSSVAKYLLKKLGHPYLKIDHTYKGDDFIPKYTCISYNHMKWIYIFETTSCSSFIEIKDQPIMSIHSIIKLLYSMYLSTHDKDIWCILQLLSAIQLNNSLSKKKIFQQFVLKCYGFQKGVVTLRKERYQRLLKRKISNE